jgi:hypothetical protein
MSNIDNTIFQIKAFTENVEKTRKSFYKEYPYSVSKILAHLKKPFDKEGVALKTYNKHYDDIDSIYYHKTIDDILNMWEEKAEFGRNNGKALDDFIELILDKNANENELSDYINKLNDVAKNKCNTYYKFYNASIKNKLDFLCREQVLAIPDLGVSGRLDAMFYYKDTILLIDWKNTEKIESSNKYEKLLGPLYEYDACDLNSYTMQVYIYKYILRHVYHLYDVNIVPLIVQVGEHDVKTYQPVIEYSDDLVIKCIEFGINAIKEENNIKNK